MWGEAAWRERKRVDLERKEWEQQWEQQENAGQQEGEIETRVWKAGMVQRREQEENHAEIALWVKDLVKG